MQTLTLIFIFSVILTVFHVECATRAPKLSKHTKVSIYFLERNESCYLFFLKRETLVAKMFFSNFFSCAKLIAFGVRLLHKFPVFGFFFAQSKKKHLICGI